MTLADKKRLKMVNSSLVAQSLILIRFIFIISGLLLIDSSSSLAQNLEDWERSYRDINCGTARECFKSSWEYPPHLEMSYKAKACDLGLVSGCVMIGLKNQKTNKDLSKRWFIKACEADSISDQRFNNCMPLINAYLRDGKSLEASVLFKKICPTENNWLCATIEPSNTDSLTELRSKKNMFSTLCNQEHSYSCLLLEKNNKIFINLKD